MTDKLKKLAPLIWKEINRADTILLHCHPGADIDSLGSALAMMHLLISFGKKVTLISGDNNLSKSFWNLPGYNLIVNKNFTQVDLRKYNLFIILDASSREQITKLGQVIFPNTLRSLIIDHHTFAQDFADLSLVDTSYPATGQILFDLMKYWKVSITHDIALCLFMAIYGDTGGFKYPLTDKESFLAAAELVEKAPDFYHQVFLFENSMEPENIRFLGLAYSRLEHYFSSKIVMSAIPHSELVSAGIKKYHTEQGDIANHLKAVIGWEIGITFYEKEPDIISVGFRTRDSDKYNVAKIAVSTGFGGGHPAAAAASLSMPYKQAKRFLLKKIAEVYPELGEA